MNIKRVQDNEITPQEWNNHVPHPVQSWEWGEARNETGIEILRYGEFENQKLVRGYQITLHEVPVINKNVGLLAMSHPPSSTMLDFLKTELKKKQVVHLQIEPYVFAKAETAGLPAVKDVRSSFHRHFYKWTVLIDLRKSEDELLQDMKSDCRKNIRKAEKNSVVTRIEDTEAGFDVFKNLLFETTQRQEFSAHTETYHRTVWSHMQQGSLAHLVNSYHNDLPVYSFECFSLNNTIYTPYSGSSSAHRNLKAGNLATWEVIRLGKSLGNEVFDMWGINPPEKNKEGWTGFSDFKERFGGEKACLVDGYDLVINPFWYTLYTKVYKYKNFILRLKRT